MAVCGIFKCVFKYTRERFDRHKFDVIFDHLHDFFKIRQIVIRNDHFLDTVSVGRHGLFTQSADRHDASPQRNFACHCHAGQYSFVCQSREQGSGNGDTG
ncbi:hypothetical protein SDC9_116818 [bioreactor metagenome]|uniref:Uncharacterized protein n=1 Tax=bioreactor metagenome TaxID=1076179 RepID=A0A645BWN5_9ZZZZ